MEINYDKNENTKSSFISKSNDDNNEFEKLKEKHEQFCKCAH